MITPKLINLARTIAILVFLAGGHGCSSLKRNPVPLNQIDQAKVEGFSGIRAWHDEFSEEFQKDFMESARQEQLMNGNQGDMERDCALVLSGGGHNGAFGAGFLKGWSETGKRPAFKVVTGISTGALIAPFAFLGAKYDGKLEENYTQISAQDIFRKKNLISAARGESAADTAPLRKLIAKYITEEVLQDVAQAHAEGRRLLIGTTHFDAQRLVIWNMGKVAQTENPEALNLFRDILLASSSLPAIFPPVYFKVTVDGKSYDEMHVDGGMIAQSFLYGSAVSYYKAKKDKNVALKNVLRPNVYVIRNWTVDSDPQQMPRKIGDIGLRAIDTLLKASAEGDLYRIYAITKRDGMDFNFVSIPDDYEPEIKDPFNKKEMNRLFSVGYQVGLSKNPWKKTPPGFSGEHQKPSS